MCVHIKFMCAEYVCMLGMCLSVVCMYVMYGMLCMCVVYVWTFCNVRMYVRLCMHVMLCMSVMRVCVI